MTNQNNNQGDLKSKCCNAPKHTHYMASLSMEGDLCSQCGRKFIPADDQSTGLGKLIEEIMTKLKTPNYFDSKETVYFFFEKSLQDIAEAAKLEERRRIEEALPKEKDMVGDDLECNCEGRKCKNCGEKTEYMYSLNDGLYCALHYRGALELQRAQFAYKIPPLNIP